MEALADSKAFGDLCKFIEDKCGIVLHEQNAHLLESRMASIQTETKVKNIEELNYKLCVLRDTNTFRIVIEAITTNETFWFRDKSLWFMIENLFLPEWVNRLQNGKSDKIKIWSAACSYGQEPYSMAMCILNYLKIHGILDVHLTDFEIVATDISDKALKMATSAKYDAISMSRGLSENDRETYFIQEGEFWHLKDTVISGVSFQQFNLVDDAYRYEAFDLVLFRNVLIYFSENNKKMIYKKIAQSLKSDGSLCIGSSELMEDTHHLFNREQFMDGVYFKKKI